MLRDAALLLLEASDYLHSEANECFEDIPDTTWAARNFVAGGVSNQSVTPWPDAIERTSVAIIAVSLLSAVVVGQVAAPHRIKDVRPVYPRESLQAGDEGVILVELNVTPSGTVGQVRVLRSECKRLEQAALTAVRQWQFEPVLLNGTPVPFTISAYVPFRLPARFKERAGRTGACKWKEPLKPIYE